MHLVEQFKSRYISKVMFMCNIVLKPAMTSEIL